MSEQQPPSPLPPSEQQQQQPQIKQEPPSQQQEQEQQQQPPPPPPVPAPSAEPAPAPTSTSNTVTPDPATASEPVTVKVKEEPDAPSAATLDASIEKEDIDMGGTGGAAGDNTAPQASGTSTVPAVDGAADAPGPAHVETEVNPVAPAPTPTKKDASLREFLGKMDEYAPIIPDAVTAHYLTLAGLPPPGHGPNSTPPHLARLLALATQKFVADIAADAYQYSRIRSSNTSSGNNPMGGLNVASGLAIPGQPTAGGHGGAPGAGAGGDGSKGKSGAGGAHLGVQRAGFGGGGQGGSGQGRTVLTMEDLGMAVGEYGVTVKRGEFYR